MAPTRLRKTSHQYFVDSIEEKNFYRMAGLRNFKKGIFVPFKKFPPPNISNQHDSFEGFTRFADQVDKTFE